MPPPALKPATLRVKNGLRHLRWPKRTASRSLGLFEDACRRAAYAFVRRVKRESDAAADAINAIAAPCVARAKLGRRPRRELLAGTARDWATLVPIAGRLGDLHISRERLSLTVRDVRIMAGAARFPGDTAPRPGVAVVLCELIVTPKKVAWQAIPVASVGIHPLRRWHERAARTTDADLVRDLTALALAYDDVLRRAESGPETDFRVPLAHGGAWVGVVAWQAECRTSEPVLALAVGPI